MFQGGSRGLGDGERGDGEEENEEDILEGFRVGKRGEYPRKGDGGRVEENGGSVKEAGNSGRRLVMVSRPFTGRPIHSGPRDFHSIISQSLKKKLSKVRGYTTI